MSLIPRVIENDSWYKTLFCARTAIERAGLSRDPDTNLVRHIYDLQAMLDQIDREEFVRLVPLIAAADATEFRNQHPAYAVDMKGETRSAVTALQTDNLYRKRYNNFMSALVFGDRPDIRLSIGTVIRLIEAAFEHPDNL